MAFNGADIEDLDATTPDGSTDAPSTLDDAIREIKTVYKNQNAIISKSGVFTVGSTNSIVLCDASGGAFTINLPAVATVSSSTFIKQYTIIKTDSSANAITIDGDGSETIDGATTTTVNNQYGAKTVTGDGTEWFTGRIDEIVDTAQIADDAVTLDKIEDFLIHVHSDVTEYSEPDTPYITKVNFMIYKTASMDSLTGVFEVKQAGGVGVATIAKITVTDTASSSVDSAEASTDSTSYTEKSLDADISGLSDGRCLVEFKLKGFSSGRTGFSQKHVFLARR